ncbi:MAG: hypothetical protein GY862_25825 [Gammaproteobacteria bacterium]|nr:hypothetical protein [Gammaproteobacteria bacterium]
MNLLAIYALSAFTLGLILLGWFAWPPAAAYHLLLAAGTMPLIMGAMVYFTPVLTRSGTPGRHLFLLPAFGLLAGVWAVAALLIAPARFHAGAFAGILACAVLGGWMWRRGKQCLGSPHPCLYWYMAALSCLVAGLIAILLTAVLPEQWLALKRFHIHINILGFISLTALGTLQVLLPTATRRPDPDAARRLRTDLKYALSGAWLTAIGAAWFTPAAWLGLLCWIVPFYRLFQYLRRLSKTTRQPRWFFPESALLLKFAAIGLAVCLLMGLAHGMGWQDASASLVLFFLWFLLPLVMGAGAWLLPVWQQPAETAEKHTLARERLCQWCNWQVLALLIAGGLPQPKWGIGAGVIVLVTYLFQVIRTRISIR